MSTDREFRPEAETGGEGEGIGRPGDEDVEQYPAEGSGDYAEGSESDVEDSDEDVEDSDEDVEDSDEDDDGDRRSEQDQWRRFGWVALAITTTGVAWALVLATILINRSGDRTAELISLFEEGQQERTAALGQIPQSQEQRQAALESQLAQTRAFQADARAARASQAKDEAAARQALADSAMAQARARQADAQAALAQAQANRANAAQPSLSISLERQQIELQEQLKKALNDLRAAIEELRPGRPAALVDGF